MTSLGLYRAVTTPSDAIAGAVSDVAARAAKDAARSALDAVSQWVAESLGTVVGMVLREMQKTTEVRLADVLGGGAPVWRTTLGLAAFLLLGAVCAAVLQGVVRAEPGPMLRRVAVGLPTAVLATLVVVPLTQVLLEATDALAADIVGPALDPLQRLVGNASAVAGPGLGFVGFVLGVLAVTAAIGVWIELFARSALLFVVVAVSPIAFAAAVWPSMRQVAHRIVHIVLALLFAKPMVAVVLAVGGAVVERLGVGTDVEQKAGTLIIGLFVMLLAVFAPYGLLRILPLTESAIVAQGASAVPAALLSGLGSPLGGGSPAGGQLRELATGGAPGSPGGAAPAAGPPPTTASSGSAGATTTTGVEAATVGASSSGAASSSAAASGAASSGTASGSAGAAAGPAAAVAAPLVIAAMGFEAGRQGARNARAAGDTMAGS